MPTRRPTPVPTMARRRVPRVPRARINLSTITHLYKDEKDPINVIKWTKIYNCLEATIDVCEDISDCIADTVMKNS